MMAKPYIPTETNFSLIDCEQAFGALDEKQALYSYYFAKASWNGAKICFFERSFESPAMLYIILKAF
jgi:dipeptidyl-peptidase-3